MSFLPRRIPSLLILLTAVLGSALLPVAARAAVFVDPDSIGGVCSDTRTLTEASAAATPVCTLSRGVALAGQGGEVTLRAATYPALSISGGATRPTPLRVAAHPGEIATVEGAWLTATAHVQLERLTFSRAPVLDEGVHHVLIGDNRITGGITINGGTHHIEIARNHITSPRSMGVMFSSDPTEDFIEDVVIRGNRFEDIGVAAINARRFKRVLIEGNEFSGVHSWDGIRHPDVIRTMLESSGLTVRGNYLHDNRAIGFFIKDGFVSDVVLENNLIVRTLDGFYAVSIYDADRVRIRNNTIADNSGSIVFAGTATNVDFANNISNGLVISGTVSWTLRDYNLISGKGASGPHDLNLAPKYVDRAGGDYRLAPGSPGIDAGLSDGSPDRDLLGNPRTDDPDVPDLGGGAISFHDMGAYEHVTQVDAPTDPDAPPAGPEAPDDALPPASTSEPAAGEPAEPAIIAPWPPVLARPKAKLRQAFRLRVSGARVRRRARTVSVRVWCSRACLVRHGSRRDRGARPSRMLPARRSTRVVLRLARRHRSRWIRIWATTADGAVAHRRLRLPRALR